MEQEKSRHLYSQMRIAVDACMAKTHANDMLRSRSSYNDGGLRILPEVGNWLQYLQRRYNDISDVGSEDLQLMDPLIDSLGMQSVELVRRDWLLVYAEEGDD
jgi:hypothetical protein